MTLRSESTFSELIEYIYTVVLYGVRHRRSLDISMKNDLPNSVSSSGQWFRENSCLFLIFFILCVNKITTNVVK